MKDFLSPHNVTFDWLDRLYSLNEFTLYVSDSFWVFNADEYYEFYYNPSHYMGKIRQDQMPEIVLDRIISTSAVFTKESIKYFRNHLRLRPSSVLRLAKVEKKMCIGNLFHMQGKDYATWNGALICFDKSVPGRARECKIQEIDGAVVYDMLRMKCLSRTEYYIKELLDFNIFDGVDVSKIEILPFNEEWDAVSWSHRFSVMSDYIRTYKDIKDIETLKIMRKDVFFHTVNIVRNGYYKLNGEKIELPKSETQKMIDNTVFYSDLISTSNLTILSLIKSPEVPDKTDVKVVNRDCLSAAYKLQQEGYNVAVLNMANRQNPGGGVFEGDGAQEESIFRRSNIHLSLFQYAPYANKYRLQMSENQYPLDRNFGGIYTPDAYVFRGEEAKGYPLLGKDSFFVSFISVPGMNTPEITSEGKIADYLVEPYKNKIRTILRIGLVHKHDALVLGALGCGAFHTPPKHMARLFHEVLVEREFYNKFKSIYFAIKEDNRSYKGKNYVGKYRIFKDEFEYF